MYSPTVGSYQAGVSYERGTPVGGVRTQVADQLGVNPLKVFEEPL